MIVFIPIILELL